MCTASWNKKSPFLLFLPIDFLAHANMRTIAMIKVTLIYL